jgi:hypothetical protein
MAPEARVGNAHELMFEGSMPTPNSPEPYVAGRHVSPPAGRPYADRARRAPGMIHAGDAGVRAFAAVGWSWGGAWRNARDYQRFSASGR